MAAVNVNIFDLAKQIHAYDVIRKFRPDVDLRQFGGRWRTSCFLPFHKDKTPSFYVFTDGGWRCFGCGEHGDSVDLVSKLFNLKPVEAARLICKEFGLLIDELTVFSRQKLREAQADRMIEENFKKWLDDSYISLCVLFRLIENVLNYQYENLDYTRLLVLQDKTSNLLNILQHGPLDRQINLYKSWHLRGFGLCG